GDLSRALKFAQESEAICKQVRGESHPDYAFSLNNLGTAYIRVAQYEHAVPLLRKALELMEANFGANDPKCAIIAGNLADLQFRLKNFDEALRFAQRSLKRVLQEF
ncbi:MAG: tetratricopeptide repeat protein, partial [Planctomycetes bacterium]|nr:tetratricopeptide repeat protein [Planctomycetota bacterium]